MRPYEHSRADAIKRTLIRELGGKCVECGTKKRLEFNHKFRRTWRANAFNIYQRMLKLQKEAALDLIDLRCRSCNAAYRPLPNIDSQVPF